MHVISKNSFYTDCIDGWYVIQEVDFEKGNARLKIERAGHIYKVFENTKGVCFIVEHEYDEYGTSTWDEKRQVFSFIYVGIDAYLKV